MATKPAKARRAANSSQTLERGLQILRVLAEHSDGLSVSELAATMKTHRPGIYRLLGPLTEQRLVVRSHDGRYTLGLGLLELASQVQPRLQEVAVRELRTLADELRATTALTVRDGDEAVVAAVVEPRGVNLRVAYRAGLRHPITVAAPGLAILAGGLPRPGERAEVEAARQLGYACTTGELLPGATGIAVPIIVPGREAEACISAVWIESRDPETMAGPVMRTAKAIATALV